MDKLDKFHNLIQEILFQHNKIRIDPQSYIPLIQNQMKYLNGYYLQLPNELPTFTFEGRKAYDEAIIYLSKRKPLHSLTYSEDLSKSSNDHVNDMGPKGSVDIISSNGDDLIKRIERYCEWSDLCTESFNFGGKTGEEIIIGLVVDDGFPDRIHRENIFNEEVKNIGLASGYHNKFNIMNVLTYAGGLRKKGTTLLEFGQVKYPYPKDVNKNRFKRLLNKFADNPEEKIKLNEYFEPVDYDSITISKSTKNCQNKDVIVERKVFKQKDNNILILIVEKEYF